MFVRTSIGLFVFPSNSDFGFLLLCLKKKKSHFPDLLNDAEACV